VNMEEFAYPNLANIYSADRAAQNKAYTDLLTATNQPVGWAYEVWDELVAALKHKDNHVRSIAAQALCNLAKSDPQKRMLRDFNALLAVTKDDRFVTARHCLQAIWKVGTAGEAQRQKLMDGLTGRFKECVTEKNGTLIRYDILQGLRNLYDQVQDEAIREKALALIDMEEDLKYRKKYASLWRGS
jgi:hypothetical protein